MRKQTQFANTPFRFSCEHSGTLPNLGGSNSFAAWIKHPDYKKGGLWRCKKCYTKNVKERQRGTGSLGLLTRMTYLLRLSRRPGKSGDGLSPKATPEELLQKWESQKDRCAACKDPIKILNASLDHNHKTGAVRGFVHRHCNMAEGCLKDMSDEALKNLLRFYRPEIKTL